MVTGLKKRNIFPLLAIGVILALGGCRVQPGDSEGETSSIADVGTPERLPNIVWIISDDQSFHDFGFAGHEIVQTPQIDRMAAESMVFRNGYNATSLCRPSLATLITGKHQHEHRITFNDPQGEGIDDGKRRGLVNQLMLNQAPAPELLAEAGYVSLQTGKFWEGSYRNGGFDEGMTVGARHGDLGLDIGRKGLEPIRDFVDRHKGKPKFIWYAPFLPHTPHNAPEKYEAPFAGLGLHEATLRYYASILWFDETVGELIDLMKQAGEYEDTLFVFMTDNGWVTAEDPADRLVDRSDGKVRPPHWKSKQSQYDLGVRTPVLLHWPGKIEPGEADGLVSSIDIVPTSLAAAGLKIPAELKGLNLLPRAIDGDPIGRDAVFGSIFGHTAKDWRDPESNLFFRWIRKGDWKLIVPHVEGEPIQLYDLDTDPFEDTNLAEEQALQETVKDLKATLDAWWTPASS